MCVCVCVCVGVCVCVCVCTCMCVCVEYSYIHVKGIARILKNAKKLENAEVRKPKYESNKKT